MKDIPSLFSLCLKTITWNVMHGCGYSQDLFELPSVFLDGLLMILPPLALQNISELSTGSTCKQVSTVNSINIKRKRGRCNDLNAWETFYMKRWPESIKRKHQFSSTAAYNGRKECELTPCAIDWQQLYWERHLQDCLDAATEQALLPAFDGNITELEVPDDILSLIGHFGSGDCKCSKLVYHCSKFGCYARCLRIQSVLCHDEIIGNKNVKCHKYGKMGHYKNRCTTGGSLRESKLDALVLRRILSGRHVEGACKLIFQNRETLVSIELVYCKLNPLDMDLICSSIYSMETHSHDIQHFSIKSSNIFGSKLSSIPSGLFAFLSSGRSLHSVCFADTHIGLKSAEGIFEALIESSSGLVNFEMSGNELEGWLSNVGTRCKNFSPFSRPCMFLQSLVLLNLRSNNLQVNDMADLHHVLINLPKLLSLDLSDNPITDDGLRRLIPFFVKILAGTSHSTEIWLENCDLSVAGVSELFQSLAMMNGQLKTLSFAENDLGSSVAAPLAKFLGMSRLRNLNIEDIGLGPFGFQELDRKIPKEMALAHINISKNRGGIQAAHFIGHIVSQAPDIVSINAGSNLLPPESLSIILDSMRKLKDVLQTYCQGIEDYHFVRVNDSSCTLGGKLELLDLTGNTSLCSADHESTISQFQFQGNAIIRLSSFHPLITHDDDP